MGDWMTQVIDNFIADAEDGADFTLSELSYSNRQAAYIGETLTTGGHVTAIEEDNAGAPIISVELFVKNAEGEVITPGTAVITRLIP